MDLKELYIYYEHFQQMAVKGLVLKKSGKECLEEGHLFLIYTKAPMGSQ